MIFLDHFRDDNDGKPPKITDGTNRKYLIFAKIIKLLSYNFEFFPNSSLNTDYTDRTMGQRYMLCDPNASVWVVAATVQPRPMKSVLVGLLIWW